MPSPLQTNLELLGRRQPELAAKVAALPVDSVALARSQDGSHFYAAKSADGSWRALSDNVSPIARAQAGLDAYKENLASTLNPALIVGLNPGLELDVVYEHFKSQMPKYRFFRRVYILVDSMPNLLGWLKAADRGEILNNPEVSFWTLEEIPKLIELLESDRSRSHNFMPISALPEPIVNRLIEPLAGLFVRRQRQRAAMIAELDAYYAELDDEALAATITGKAGRPPRLLFSTHASSTVVQYTSRDLCETLRRRGWEARVHLSTHACSEWEVAKSIHEFKPDVYVIANHLRNEKDISLYPRQMMFVTWIQDTCSYINNRQAAAEWLAMINEEVA